MTIGQKIKYLRTSLKYTQEELARAANTTKQTIHKYETGIIDNIPASKIKAIADKLNTTPAYLMGWSDTVNPDIVLSQHEQNLILAYRNQPAMQEAVDKLLGVSSETVFPVDDVVSTVNAIDENIQKARCNKTQK